MLDFPLFQKLRPQGLELQQGELGDLVEQEMAATSAAVESAAARIEVHKCVWEGCLTLVIRHQVFVRVSSVKTLSPL